MFGGISCALDKYFCVLDHGLIAGCSEFLLLARTVSYCVEIFCVLKINVGLAEINKVVIKT